MGDVLPGQNGRSAGRGRSLNRILSYSSIPPYPPNHGLRLRTWNLLSRVARAVEVTLVTWRMHDTTPEIIDALDAAFGDVLVLPMRGFSAKAADRAMRQFRFVTGGLPPYVQAMIEDRGLSSPSSTQAFIQEIEVKTRGQFDLVVAEEEAMCFVPRPSDSIPLVVHRLNVFDRMIRDLRARAGRPARAGWLAERASWRRFDREAMRGCSLAIATTRESSEALSQIAPETQISVIPNGVDMRKISTPLGAARDLAFIGWMDYAANVDAVTWFAKNVWPEVHRSHPESRFRVIGREPTSEVLALEGDGIVVTGEVPDMTGACEGVRVGVVPLWAGMGIKNKTLELMSMGIPVVATPSGAEGLSVKHDDGLFEASDPSSFRDCVLRLMSDDELAARSGTAAHAYVEKNHSWESIADQYLAALAAASEGRNR